MNKKFKEMMENTNMIDLLKETYPKSINELEEALKFFTNVLKYNGTTIPCEQDRISIAQTSGDYIKHCELAIKVIEEQLNCEIRGLNKLYNKPLILEQLKQRINKPVWIEYQKQIVDVDDNDGSVWKFKVDVKEWNIIKEIEDDWITFIDGRMRRFCILNVYDCELKGETICNSLLTIDDLKDMIGKPIWVNYNGGGYYGLMTSQGLLCPNGQFKNYEILKMWELYRYEIKGE